MLLVVEFEQVLPYCQDEVFQAKLIKNLYLMY